MIATANSNIGPVRIALRRRADLVIEEQKIRGVSMWVVKDPIALKYYRFSAEEFAIWSLLDGRATDIGIVRALHKRWSSCELVEVDVREFAESLYNNGLVVSDTAKQGQRLVGRRQKSIQQQRWMACLNVLAIRFRGIDLTWLLRVLYPFFSWFFRPVAICAVGALAAVAGCVALLHIELLTTQIVALHDHFGPGSWLLLACTIAVTKMLHELGHALACKHCGGECHEIGVMLLVLTPCLYCDVSDSWLLPNKWHRAAIAAAGMYVEVALASIATLVWWLSAPGVLHYLSLQVILICSVSTLLFNGNPLTRYDGYYILADLIEVPNLRQQSRSALKDLLLRVCFGIERAQDVSESRSPWLVVYGVASLIYRWLLLATILWFLHGFFVERGLEVLWHLITTLTIGTAVLLPVVRGIRFIFRKEVLAQMDRRRLILTGTCATIVLGMFFLLPMPQRVLCTFETRLKNSVPIYVRHDARLDEIHVTPGQRVKKGQQLADLSRLDLQFDIARLTTESATQEFRVNNLKYERFQNDDAIEALPQAAEILAATDEQLDQRLEDLSQLTLCAPKTGVVFAPPRYERTITPGYLPVWSGTPLDQGNQGSILKAGEVMCEIGDPEQWEAVLIIDQADMEQVRTGQDVRLLLDALSLSSLSGQVAEISQQKLDRSPESLSIQSGGQLSTHTDRFGNNHPTSSSYTALVPIEGIPAPLAIGLRGTASIRTGSITLASRLWQYLCRTFCFA